MSTTLQNAFLGSLIADAAAMPVHWYYDTQALDRDYPEFSIYTAPKNPHPDSILWRSKYNPGNRKADILHDQARYWGKRGVHYHQFLPAGGNTLNYRLAIELYRLILDSGKYQPEEWLDTYTQLMTDPQWSQDTYVEEYHRAFFDRWSKGTPLKDCGIDDLHIGGIATVPALLAGFYSIGNTDTDSWIRIVRGHVALTHKNSFTLDASEALARILIEIAAGKALDHSLEVHGKAWGNPLQFQTWSKQKDRMIVGRQLTPACYLPDSFSASLYLAWKYQSDFKSGIIANALCGGDNCHRGAVVGSILGALNSLPGDWLQGLLAKNRVHKEIVV